jgi:xanthine dehydrogenase small subunit
MGLREDRVDMRRSIQFLLGDELVVLDRIDPTMTVLDWLRGPARLIGTKEGCNEGDCGACTVVVARPVGSKLEYRAVNACIQFVGTLDGCQLITVEHLKSKDGALHPVQQALVDFHGSQCGFCTPGFVMSLFALVHQGKDRPAINDALAGNLCRCTGYTSIAAAAESVLAKFKGDAFAADAATTLQKLTALDNGASIAVGDGTRMFHAPATLDELASLYEAHPDATIIAGSTDVGLWVTKAMRRLDRVIWIGRITGLHEIHETESALAIGAGVTHTDAMGPLAALYPDMGEIWRRFASVQVRNAGTVGGNIANGSPIGDGSPTLIAAGANIRLRKGTTTRTLPLEDFFITYGKQDRAPGEFVEALIVPKPTSGSVFRAYKISKRFDQDISAVLGAFLLRFDGGKIVDARIAFGGMAATPKRATWAEKALVGKALDRSAVMVAQRALAEDFKPISDMRASAAYRLKVAQNLLERLRLELSEPAVATRLVGNAELAHA